jgi:hypothetical protein
MAFIEGRAYDLSKLAEGEELVSNPLRVTHGTSGEGQWPARSTVHVSNSIC